MTATPMLGEIREAVFAAKKLGRDRVDTLVELTLARLPICRNSTVRERYRRIIARELRYGPPQRKGLTPLRFRFSESADDSSTLTTSYDDDRDVGTAIQRLCDELDISDKASRTAIADAVMANRHPKTAANSDPEDDGQDTEESVIAGRSKVGNLALDTDTGNVTMESRRAVPFRPRFTPQDR